MHIFFMHILFIYHLINLLPAVKNEKAGRHLGKVLKFCGLTPDILL